MEYFLAQSSNTGIGILTEQLDLQVMLVNSKLFYALTIPVLSSSRRSLGAKVAS